MDAVLRAIAIYLFLLLIFRVSGKRTLAQITTFDLVLLLIIGEATQQALIGDDFSVTKAWLLILTLIGLEIALSELAGKFKIVDKWLNGVPLVLVQNGNVLRERMGKSRVDESDIL